MVDLYLRFKTSENLLIILLFALICCLWIYRNLKSRSRLNLTPFVLISLAIFIGWGCLADLSHDEPEHLHCSWMIAQGLVPFKDFWQHHPPLLWIILAPFFKIFKPAASIFGISRIFSAVIFTGIVFTGWQIAKKVLKEKANLLVYLLILFCSGVAGEFLFLRPDLFMDLFLLFGLYYSLEIPGKKLLPVFLSGVSFALAASFIFKQYLLFLLPVIIILRENNRLKVAKLAVYMTGLIIGCSPLLFYLIKNNLLNDFIFWVFKFNQKKIGISVFIPIVIAFMGAWGARLLLMRYRNFKDNKALILLIALCLSTLNSLTTSVDFTGRYYLGFWFILCAIVGNGCNIMEIPAKISSLIGKSLILGFFFALLIIPNSILATTYINTFFDEDRKAISKLIDYSKNESCFVILNMHPVFAFDTTRLYSYWQYYLLDESSPVKGDIKSKNIAESIINLRPPVVMHTFKKKFFILDLFQKGVISAEDYKRLVHLFKNDYALVQIGRESYYIRKDKL
jgi:hypothetical protein